MRGEKEEACLSLIQRKMGSIEGSTTFLGCSLEEERMLKSVILEAKENPSNNDFPDFVFEGGYIEHFQITSGKENRKGSAHIATEVKFEREFEKKIEEIETNDPTFENEVNFFETHELIEHKHQYLIESMRKNSEKHLQSLVKYNRPDETAIFMIQYTDDVLEVLNCDDKNLQHPAGFIYYHPHLDIEILKCIQNFSNSVNFVIFVFSANSHISFPYDAGFEIFSTKKISAEISRIESEKYEFSALNLGITQSYQNIKARVHEN